LKQGITKAQHETMTKGRESVATSWSVGHRRSLSCRGRVQSERAGGTCVQTRRFL